MISTIYISVHGRVVCSFQGSCFYLKLMVTLLFSLSTVKLSECTELVWIWGIRVVGRPSAFSDIMTPHILQDVIIQSLIPGFLRDEAFMMSISKCFVN